MRAAVLVCAVLVGCEGGAIDLLPAENAPAEAGSPAPPGCAPSGKPMPKPKPMMPMMPMPMDGCDGAACDAMAPACDDDASLANDAAVTP